MEALDTGDAYSFTFTTPGTYQYFCSVHPHIMTGAIVVEEATGSNGANYSARFGDTWQHSQTRTLEAKAH